MDNMFADKREYTDSHAANSISKALAELTFDRNDFARASSLHAFVEGGFITEARARERWVEAGGDEDLFDRVKWTQLKWVAVRSGADPADVVILKERWCCGPNPWGNARGSLEAWLQGTRFSLVTWQGQTWRYARGFYKPMEDGELRRILARDFALAYTRVVNQRDDGSEEVQEVSVKPNDKRTQLVDVLVPSLAHLTYRESELPPDPVLNFRNARLDPNSGHLLPHTPASFVISQIGADFQPDAVCPNWEAFVESSLPDREQAELLQEICGYLLSGRQEQQKIFGFWGQKRSGKSTILRILERLMGPGSIASPSLSSLTGAFGLAAAKNASVIQIGEARFDRDTKSAIDILLRISGRDLVEVNVKNRPAFQARLPGRIVMVSNEQPNVLEDSGALASRFVHLDFKVSFLGREDLSLEDKLEKELAGIARWCLEGLQRLRERGKFPETKAHVALSRAQNLISNHAEVWYQECVRVSEEDTPNDAFFKSYLDWCEEHDVEEGVRYSAERLGRLLTRSGHPSKVVKVHKKATRVRERLQVTGYSKFESGPIESPVLVQRLENRPLPVTCNQPEPVDYLWKELE